MIAYLKGIAIKKTLEYVIIDVNGVGYKVFAPLSTLCNIEENKEVSLIIETFFKEDSINLYGFFTEDEKTVFIKLLSVSKIGPKLGLTILSGLSVEKIISAITNKDIKLLSSVPGIGKKTAERICFDLKDSFSKIDISSESDDFLYEDKEKDLINALINLGYKQNEVKTLVENIIKENSNQSLENLLKITLNKLYNG